MDATPDPYDYSTETLLRSTARENATLRELLTAVAGDLERLASQYPELAERLLARAMRLRKRLLGGGRTGLTLGAVPWSNRWRGGAPDDGPTCPCARHPRR